VTIAATPDPAPGEPPSRFAGLVTLLFSFRGRMSRRALWTRFFPAFLLVSTAALIAAAILTWVGLDNIVMLTFFVFILWSATAAYVRRCHDRGRSVWFLVLALLPSVLVFASAMGLVIGKVAEMPFAMRILDDMQRVPSEPAVAASYAGYFIVLGLLALAANMFQLWVMIELYFLRGTVGDNRYGPDPAARA
jgi:uncharacterized membrane protein YhaH (DUF805 family)